MHNAYYLVGLVLSEKIATLGFTRQKAKQQKISQFGDRQTKTINEWTDTQG